MCNIHALLAQSVVREVEQTAEEDLTFECVVLCYTAEFHMLTHPSAPPEENVVSMWCSKSR